MFRFRTERRKVTCARSEGLIAVTVFWVRQRGTYVSEQHAASIVKVEEPSKGRMKMGGLPIPVKHLYVVSAVSYGVAPKTTVNWNVICVP